MKHLAMIMALWFALSTPGGTTTFYVGVGNSAGSGTASNPFTTFSAALAAAQPGDTVLVLPGVYTSAGAIRTVRSGLAGQRIVVRGADPANPPIIQINGKVASIDHAYITLESLILDAGFAASDAVKITSGGDFAVLRDCEVRNGTKDGVDISNADNVLIENCRIHHFLAGTFTSQQDAHGIVATGEHHLTIRGCSIFYVSGDCFQTDPSRGYPLWDDVVIEDCKLWTGPLPAPAANFHAGEVPGENAVDTKINPDAVASGYRPSIIIRNVEAYGFEPGFIPNRAAFNIKEQVNCWMENVVVHHNEIAFRLRGPGSRGGAHVTLINPVAYENVKVFRIEDGLELLHIYNGTFDRGANGTYFSKVSGGYDPAGFDLRNSLFMGNKPSDASDPSNLAADAGFFLDVAHFNYHLAPGSPAIDAGVTIAEVTVDMDGQPRTPGSYDVGADEFSGPTGVEEPGPVATNSFQLFPNFPNPFNPSTTIRFSLKRALPVTLSVYSVTGQRVRTLVDGELTPGEHRVVWDGRSDAGTALGSGVYFYRLQAGRQTQVRMMHLLR